MQEVLESSHYCYQESTVEGEPNGMLSGLGCSSKVHCVRRKRNAGWQRSRPLLLNSIQSHLTFVCEGRWNNISYSGKEPERGRERHWTNVEVLCETKTKAHTVHAQNQREGLRCPHKSKCPPLDKQKQMLSMERWSNKRKDLGNNCRNFRQFWWWWC